MKRDTYCKHNSGTYHALKHVCRHASYEDCVSESYDTSEKRLFGVVEPLSNFDADIR